ncbi:hypothetical protein Tco_1507613 [Tanacetum coccineum]
MSSQEQPSQVPLTEPITDSFTTSHPTQTPSLMLNEPPLGEGSYKVKKVKHLEAKLKSTSVRRMARMVISDDEEDLVLEDPSKQGRMTKTKYEDVDVETEYEEVKYELDQTDTLQQFTPTKVSQGEEQSQDSSEVKLDVFNAAKILADAFKKKSKDL